MKVTTIVAMLLAALIVGGTLIYSTGVLSGNTASSPPNTAGAGNVSAGADANNVSVVDGKQIVEVAARGGYRPKKSTAKAGIPTVLRFTTKGTYDCSSVIRIPSMNINQSLPSSGSIDIDLGTPAAGALRGTCGMGMYTFEVDFQS